jgi:ATP-dependent Clp protease ATP-binding subunit ClpB
MLKELKDSLAGRGLTLSWDESLGNYLAEKAYSPVYGARNLRRTIQTDLEDPISERIIDSFEAPISGIRISVDGEALQVESV